MAADNAKLRDASSDELRTQVRQMREQLFKLRWQAASGQAENPRKIREVRRDIARHLTVLNQRADAQKAQGAQENQ